MKKAIIPMVLVTDEDRKRGEEYARRRFLYNRYTDEELRDWTKVDLYEALDLDAFKLQQVPEYVIKYAVRMKIVQYHPARNQDRQQAFILIKTAEKIFTNPRYKKLYDSISLDENLPEDREYSLAEFIDVFSPVFERNGAFSEVQPVPGLADDVGVFYKFWHSFKTVRVYDDPYDVFEQRGYARRANAEKNKEIVQKRRQADCLRIMELVKLAYRRDPRIVRAPRAATAEWKENELKSLARFNMLLGKSKDKYSEIAKKLNHLFLTKRTPQEIKAKIESQERK